MAQSAAAGYSGQAYSPQGDKGRFVLPPTFRKAVKDASDTRVLCLTKHPRWTCLTAFGLDRKASLEGQLEREEQQAIDRGVAFDRDTRAMQLFTFNEVSFDDSGRFILPDHLARLARIEDGLFFLGGGRDFTLWSKTELDRMGEGWEMAQAACASLVAEAEAKRR